MCVIRETEIDAEATKSANLTSRDRETFQYGLYFRETKKKVVSSRNNNEWNRNQNRTIEKHTRM